MRLCDENYQIKHENRDLEDKLKLLSARIMRVSSAGALKKFKSTDGLSQSSKENDEHVAKLLAPKRRPNTVPNVNELLSENEALKAANHDLQSKHLELEARCKELDAKMFDETKKLVNATMDAKSQKRKTEKYEMQVKHLKAEKREIERKLESFTEDSRRKIDALRSALDDERATNERLTDQASEVDRNKKHLHEMKEQILQLQVEKGSLKVQQENFTKLIEESASNMAVLDDLRHQNEVLQSRVQYEKAENDALKGCQAHLLVKVQELQDQNDQLSVSCEGLKGKLEFFTNENVSLELRLRDVEATLGNRTVKGELSIFLSEKKIKTASVCLSEKIPQT